MRAISPNASVVRRSIALLIVAPFMMWSTWGRSPLAVESHAQRAMIAVQALHLPSADIRRSHLGPFEMEGAWEYKSTNAKVFGYSALLAREDGRFFAFNDSGATLEFSPPQTSPPRASPTQPIAKWLTFSKRQRAKSGKDVESVVYDPDTQQYWLGLEGRNQIVRLSRELKETGRASPESMKGWGINSGAEAMARLQDGRFIALREIPLSFSERRLHEALLFDGDPIEYPKGRLFQFEGAKDFSAVDMVVLPDGRALILMRRLLWPAPMRYAGRIVIADTRQIQPGQVWRSIELAQIEWPLRNDNFEAITAVPQSNGHIAVWIMSDDNKMRVLQRTLLWKLTVDPNKLPWPH